MTMLDGLSILVLLFWLSRWPHFRRSALRDLPRHPGPSEGRLVTMIVAARDEALAIESNVRSLLSQTYPAIELIVVNDRSVDDTAAILDRLAREYPQLRVLHNQELPSAWLGKCWALHRGSQLARGDWLLFCDGDVLMEPSAIEQALVTAEFEKLDHLCMAPRLVCSGWWQEAVITSLTFLFYTFQDPRHVFDPRKLQAYMGVGAFNLIRRRLYETLGGHEALRLEIVDDVFLGMLVKRHGGASGFFLGLEQASIHWYPSLWEYIRGLEKNSFAGLRFSVSLLSVAVIGQLLVFHVPLFAALGLAQGWAQLTWFLSFVLPHVYFLIICRRSQVSPTKVLGLMPAILIQFFAFLRSAFLTLRRGGVSWRGTFYPLDQLREAQQRLRGPLFRFRN